MPAKIVIKFRLLNKEKTKDNDGYVFAKLNKIVTSPACAFRFFNRGRPNKKQCLKTTTQKMLPQSIHPVEVALSNSWSEGTNGKNLIGQPRHYLPLENTSLLYRIADCAFLWAPVAVAMGKT